jgi:hypothetical protein
MNYYTAINLSTQKIITHWKNSLDSPRTILQSPENYTRVNIFQLLQRYYLENSYLVAFLDCSSFANNPTPAFMFLAQQLKITIDENLRNHAYTIISSAFKQASHEKRYLVLLDNYAVAHDALLLFLRSAMQSPHIGVIAGTQIGYRKEPLAFSPSIEDTLNHIVTLTSED